MAPGYSAAEGCARPGARQMMGWLFLVVLAVLIGFVLVDMRRARRHADHWSWREDEESGR